ncbi:hypothetical protein L1047_09215 [Synechococcus sp. Nb3U1]|uniref:Piwi domain-containing protein n=1 Tax=Synechococcus sp. Nb3U1 TaxID=1914529 RepID=UPI001F278C3F|nr:Piwi domain-containing protein [Synechococcus sp. Nb3U1]MCF2971370.1 hypothetical protein [Synechococcus sp. Nb3U1]
MDMIIYVDVFPVIPQALPKLSAYTIKAVSDDVSAIGGKLAYRLRNKFGGNWVWCGGQIITDKPPQDEAIEEFLKQLWTEERLNDVLSVTLNTKWEPSAWEQGEFTARGLLANHQAEIRRVLEPKKQNFGKIRVDRDYALRGWAVNNEPAISITVSSNIFHTQLLHEFAATLKSPQELVGMMVAVTAKDFKGTIVEITGNVREMRERLLSKSSDEMTRNLISRAPDDELTVKIETRTSQYIYIASMLRPVVRMGDLKKFKVKPRQVSEALRLDPQTRYTLVREIAAIGKNNGILANSFNSESLPQAFLGPHDVAFEPKLRVGDDKIHQGQRIYESLEKHGAFKRSNAFPDKKHPIKIGVINASSQVAQQALMTFLRKLKAALEKLNFSIQSVEVNGQRQQKIERLSRANLENAINCFESAKPDIFLALFPGSAYHDEREEGEEASMYHVFKSLTMRLGIPSQVVYEDTFSEKYAMDNIVLGILAKTRNVPFVLAKPLPYADIVVGIDIARRAKQKLSGTMNATAMARVYFSDGQFLRYIIHDAPIEGETIPSSILRSLFPLKEFQGKRVVIHRDGQFRGGEKSALKEWAKQIGAEFHLVEVIKSGAPRLYQSTSASAIDRPPKGTAFKISDTEAFLVSSLPPFKGSTPCPLQIRTELSFSIENAIHSALSLTLLHYGSVREPRLPVTIHYSDKIGEFSLLGIKPKDSEGDVPFWL